MQKPTLDILEYNSYYQPYIEKTAGLDLKNGFLKGLDETLSFLRQIPEDKLHYRYMEGKWTIKEIIQHLIDSERVFSYRALRIAREDRTPLPGFEQDDYIAPSKANERSLDELLLEYKVVREATDLLFKSFSDKSLLNKGVASNSDVSVRAIGYIILGHERHHCSIIKERYL